MNSKTVHFIIIDWGTTNFRAFALDNDGNIVDKTEHKLGLLQVEGKQFGSSLKGILSQWMTDYEHLPIYMAGMVGSAQGWVDVPYVTSPVALTELTEVTHKFKLPWGMDAFIVPGVRQNDQADCYDVMRGEEVQLFGLKNLIEKESFVAIFPGTHSKHIHVQDGKLADFSTFMTGELFSILSQYSILGRALPDQIQNQESFVKGVLESNNQNFTNQIFSARTLRIFEQIQESHVLDYLSGLLIGYELRALDTDEVYLVGNHALCERYECAGQALSVRSTSVCGNDSFVSGMLQIKKVLHNE